MSMNLSRRNFAALAASALAVSALPLGSLASESAAPAAEPAADAADAAAAEDVDPGLAALVGTYTALMPAFREERNDQPWRDALSEYAGISGEDEADQVKDAFLAMYEADFYGNEAVALSASGYSTFDCYLEGVETFTVEGNTIS